MKPRTLLLLDRCIEDGIDLGWDRAHKHTDQPTDLAIKEKIGAAIWEQIHDWFDFEELPR